LAAGDAMTAFPIAAGAEAALTAPAEARTAFEAAAKVGGPVYLAIDMLSPRFATIAQAEAAFPSLYSDPRFEAAFSEDAWRVLIRYWRPAPPAPIARTALAALKKPLGVAGTPDEARAALGGPAELAEEELANRYATRASALAKVRALADVGLARIIEREGQFAVALTYWRPLRSSGGGLLPAERAEIAARLAQPLRSDLPQSSPFIGLFEAIAPENPAIVLAEEGDGRPFD
jgi:hypothetical protein